MIGAFGDGRWITVDDPGQRRHARRRVHPHCQRACLTCPNGQSDLRADTALHDLEVDGGVAVEDAQAGRAEEQATGDRFGLAPAVHLDDHPFADVFAGVAASPADERRDHGRRRQRIVHHDAAEGRRVWRWRGRHHHRCQGWIAISQRRHLDVVDRQRKLRRVSVVREARDENANATGGVLPIGRGQRQGVIKESPHIRTLHSDRQRCPRSRSELLSEALAKCQHLLGFIGERGALADERNAVRLWFYNQRIATVGRQQIRHSKVQAEADPIARTQYPRFNADFAIGHRQPTEVTVRPDVLRRPRIAGGMQPEDEPLF